MKVVFDTSIILLAVNPKAAVPPPPAGITAGSAPGRVKHLLETLDDATATIIVPAPSLAELLQQFGDRAVDVLNELKSQCRIRFAPFGERAAIEFAEMMRGWSTQKESRRAGYTRAKVKFDQQILAIAKVEGATTIYSDDDDLRKLARTLGMDVKGIWDLPPAPAEIEPTIPGITADQSEPPEQ